MEITTDRLVLREFHEDDWHPVLAYQSHPEYLRYYAWSDRAEQGAKEFVRTLIGWQHEQPRTRFQLVLELRDGGEVIGNCGIRRRASGLHEAELGYELAPWHWRRGYATEAARAMLRFGFRDLKLHRVFSQCIADNTASVRVLERIGMQPEGRLRENEWFKGRYWDTLLYAILDREWEAQAGGG